MTDGGNGADGTTGEDRLAALFENVSEPTIEYVYEDGEPTVLAVNEAFEEVFGYDAAEVVGQSLDDYIVPPEKQAEAADLNEKVAAGDQLEAEVRRRTADGIRTFMLRDAPIETAEGVRGFAIYADITDRVERERELQRQNERLEEFASLVSHDLRNPLTVARGHLADAYEDPGANLPEVETSLDRMEAIIEDVLALARHGDAVVDPATVDLEAVARDAWDNVETVGATLRVEGTRDLAADRDRLLGVFENLFRNSVEHGSTGDRPSADTSVEHGATGTPNPGGGDGGDPTVRVGTTAGGVYVVDDGGGIPETCRDRVFESGFTTSETGTGFGLAIVERICEAHDWDVAASEGEEGGARFEIRGIDGSL